MEKVYFDQLMQGLDEAIAIERGELEGRRTVYLIEPVKSYDSTEIRTLRKKAGMTQKVLASYLGVSVKTVEAWEKGTNKPTGSSRRLLSLMEEDKVSTLPFVTVRELTKV